jgi:hypothetical protein
MHMRGGRKVVDAGAYPDIEEFWADITRAYQEEIADLAAAGCTYLQIDDVSFATLCDEGIRGQVRRDGEDPDKLPFLYSKIISSLLSGKPEGMSVTMHTCRGNHASMWMAEGGYDAVAEGIFQTAVDGFFLEYDTSRAGGFEPLRFCPKDKKVVLGLISTKTPALEKKDALKKRIDEAAKYVPLENLCLSPQCGFASSEVGNRLSEDDEKRKLELVVQVAHAGDAEGEKAWERPAVHMDVRVDQAGDHPLPLEVDHFRGLRDAEPRARGDGLDLGAADHDDLVLERRSPGPVEHVHSHQRGPVLGRRAARGERQDAGRDEAAEQQGR